MVVRHAFQIWVLVKDVVKDVEEETQGELVEVVDEVQLLEDEEDRAASLCQRKIFGSDLFDFLHDYEDAWPVYDMIRLNLKYSSSKARKDVQKLVAGRNTRSSARKH